MQGTILIVDDNKSVLTALDMLLGVHFDQVLTLANPNSLISTLRENTVDVILLDMNYKAGINTGNEGIYWLNEINKFDASISVVMITAYGDVELAVKAVKEGAFDFVLKPWDNNKLISTLGAALKLRKSLMDGKSAQKTASNLRQELIPPSQALIAESPVMQNVLDMVRKVAVTDANILLTGENGTGKEVIAREIHHLSNRAKQVMVGVDMGAVSETLFESELFGHMKGAFTDAKENRAGKFETANKGTLFLDEIGNLSLSLQAKMLAALQNRTITRLGSNQPVPIDIRLISATNKNLQEMIADGEFREDLLYRINTITVEIPPLRERGNDIALLAQFYLKKYASKYNKADLSLSSSAIAKLKKYRWPGNVRELQHSIEKAVILADGEVLTEHNFLLQENNSVQVSMQEKTIEEMEKLMIEENIKKELGNMSLVAKNLGITRQTLYNKLKKYNL